MHISISIASPIKECFNQPTAKPAKITKEVPSTDFPLPTLKANSVINTTQFCFYNAIDKLNPGNRVQFIF